MKAISGGIFLVHEHNVWGAVVDIQHFGIIVNALLAWGEEPRPPRKTSGRHSAPPAPREGLDDDDGDDLADDDDFGADDDLDGKVEPGDPADGELIESDLAADGDAD